VYEVQLINPFDVATTIDKVEAVDSATDEVLATLEGDAVAAAMDVLPLEGEPTATLPAGGAGMLFIDLTVATRADVPRGWFTCSACRTSPTRGSPRSIGSAPRTSSGKGRPSSVHRFWAPGGSP
jgi:hypothetical protein